MTTVTWEEWECIWAHPMHQMGVYRSKSRTFTIEDEARGFATGIKSNPHVRNVVVTEKKR